MDLTPAQLSQLVDLLNELEHSIGSLLQDTEVGMQPVKLKDNHGRLSRMDEMHNQSILKANRNVLANRLKRVKIARNRLDSGDYGDCGECHEPISFNRLQAYPDANLCFDCQSAREE
jgi:DnaK suppressor protein